MSQAPKAAFRFETYVFNHFEFNDPLNKSTDGLSVFIEPSGVYNASEKRFVVNLEFTGAIPHEDEANGPLKENIVVSINMMASFIIETEDNLIPNYFYVNCLGIIFPYLRGFISTLTLQANSKNIILPLLNLSHLEGRLREKTIFE